MKNLGIVRKMDKLGRVVIPKEIRDKFQIGEGTEIEIYAKGNMIILQKIRRCILPKMFNKMWSYRQVL